MQNLPYVHDLSPFLIQFGDGIGIRYYGLSYVAAFLVGLFVYRSLARRGYSDLRPDQVGDFITGCAIFGVLVGGRLGYMLFYNFGELVADPLSIFRVWDGGMSSHGGMLGVFFFTLWYAWHYQVGWRNLGDNIVVVTPIGIFLGRMANFINGELYGRITNVSWAMVFPKELYSAQPETQRTVIAETAQAGAGWSQLTTLVETHPRPEAINEILALTLPTRHPSQLYSAALEGVFLFGLMWILRTRFKFADGVLTGLFFISYAIVRILVELFREPDAPLTGFLTRGQFLSLFLILIGIGFLLSAKLNPRYAPACQPARGA